MRKNMWEIRAAAQGEAIDLYIYGDVEGDSYDWWTDEVITSETSANYFREELAKYPNAAEINVYINSNGGSVFEGTAIYNQLRRHPAKKTVYIDGFACSVASVIAMAGDEVVMPKNALMMIHNPWMYTYGNAADLRKAADDLDTIAKGARQAYLTKAGEKLDEERLTEMMDAETWLTAEECLNLGLADRYAEKEADLSLAAGILQKANLQLEQRIKINQSLQKQLKNLQEEKEPAPPQAEGLFSKLSNFYKN